MGISLIFKRKFGQDLERFLGNIQKHPWEQGLYFNFIGSMGKPNAFGGTYFMLSQQSVL